MKRESVRTLYTLSTRYQLAVSESDYEVIVIDNNSSSPISNELVKSFGSNFNYHFFECSSPSPVSAINHGVKIARSENVAIIVDGARMVTPRTIAYTLHATRCFGQPLVMSLAWHLGSEEQNYSMQKGYDQRCEDKLLASINWKANGYQLFEIAAQASSSSVGVLGGIPQECSYLAIRRDMFIEIGGFDIGFQSPGGGYVNHDFLQRCLESESFDLVVLLSEGTFHQFHGGVATNVTPESHPAEQFSLEYQKIKGHPFSLFEQPATEVINYFCYLHNELKRFIKIDHKS